MTSFVRPWVATCDTCGKRCYLTKRDAKAVAKRSRDLGHMSTYRCGTYWHVGHLPGRVKAGDATRDQIINRRTR